MRQAENERERSTCMAPAMTFLAARAGCQFAFKYWLACCRGAYGSQKALYLAFSYVSWRELTDMHVSIRLGLQSANLSASSISLKVCTMHCTEG